MAGRKRDPQDQQGRTVIVMTLKIFAAAALCAALYAGPLAAQNAPSIAVTDLAYSERVEEYFAAGKSQTTSTLQAGKRIGMATVQSSSTYLAGTSSYLDQRELNDFSADVRSALLRGTNSSLKQGSAFDKGDPQSALQATYRNGSSVSRKAASLWRRLLLW